MMKGLISKKGEKFLFSLVVNILCNEIPKIVKSVINFEAAGTHFRDEPNKHRFASDSVDKKRREPLDSRPV